LHKIFTIHREFDKLAVLRIAKNNAMI